MSDRFAAVVLTVVLALLLFLDVRGAVLVSPDEPRYAEIPREMLATGDYITPHLNGAPYFEKPPLLYWANALSMRVFGHNAFAARLVTRLAAVGTAVLLIIALGGRRDDAWRWEWGWWSAVVFLSAPLDFALGRVTLTDGLLSFTIAVTMFAVRAFVHAREDGRSGTGALVLVGVGAALATLTKGLVGIVFPGLVFLIWVGIMGRWRRIRELLLSPAPIVFLALALPWFILVEQRNPGFTRFFFVHEHFARFATGEASRPGPIYYFVAVVAAGFLPWTFLVPRAFAPLRAWRRERFAAHADLLYFALWFLVILVFFTLSRSKLVPYILPAMPAAAALVGAVLARQPVGHRRALFAYAVAMSLIVAGGLGYGLASHALAAARATAWALAAGGALLVGAWAGVRLAPRGERRGWLGAAAGWAGLYLVATLYLPTLAAERSENALAPLAAALARDGRATLVAYGAYPQSFPWELQRPIVVANYVGELGSTWPLPDSLYWSKQEFWQRWSAGQRMVVAIRARDVRRFEALSDEPPTVLARHPVYVLLSNFIPADRNPRAVP
ncbi:MAG TPA: phospholipid carrier-dependent glycosyltransferase [Gemmatimonadaceae bacterium]|nr:phospholipid carrier-dependent glycosyltransferase [Gemmatimonadaceae bacterium]